MPDIQHIGDIEVEAEEAQPATMDIILDPPIEFAKKRFESIHLQEATGKQAETAEKELQAGPNAYTLRRYQITLIAQVGRVPREVVEQMKVSQIEAASLFLARASDPGRQTGET